ncbi:hypothetical protein AC579_4582 [Pseudocercospora musae]|uniref:Uncharacterized protein n=1 Tax=Pseudocercospora musae TaxID=113226 RepID=A0A139ITJ2_9PEZI|nr:hypothetical protein AC579_4582 [Pseudocercospora musae]KXT18099.1 hypothetical protein AC579_4582 [Pseudocercospora musae]
MARSTNRDLERQLGFISSPTKKRCTKDSPLRDLQVEIERIVDEYSTWPTKMVALSVPLRQDLDKVFAALAPRLWSDTNGRFEFFVNARDNDLEGFYTRDLFYSVPEDRSFLEEIFHKWIKLKVVRRISNVQNGMVKPRVPQPDWEPNPRRSSSTSIRTKLEYSEISDVSSCTSKQLDIEDRTGLSESGSEGIEIMVPRRPRGVQSARVYSTSLQPPNHRGTSCRKRSGSSTDEALRTKRARSEHFASNIKATPSPLVVVLAISSPKLASIAQRYNCLEKIGLKPTDEDRPVGQTAVPACNVKIAPVSGNATPIDNENISAAQSTQSPKPMINRVGTKALQHASQGDLTLTDDASPSEPPLPASKPSDLDVSVSELFTAMSSPATVSADATMFNSTTLASLDPGLLASVDVQAPASAALTDRFAANCTAVTPVVCNTASIPAPQSTSRDSEQTNTTGIVLENGSLKNGEVQVSVDAFENAEILIDWGINVCPPTFFAMEDCALVEDLFCLVERYMPTPLRAMRIKELAFEMITQIEGPKADCRIIRDNRLGRSSLRRIKKVLARQCQELDELEMKIHVEWEGGR